MRDRGCGTEGMVGEYQARSNYVEWRCIMSKFVNQCGIMSNSVENRGIKFLVQCYLTSKNAKIVT